MRTLLLASAVLLAALLVGACSGGPATLRTQPLSQAPSIDGSLAEWKGTLTRVGDQSVAMSVFPTDTTLYVALSVRGRTLLRSVAEKGLTVWVDPSGGQRHAYGVRYPIGLPAQRKERKATDNEGSETSRRSTLLDQVFPSDLAVLRDDTLRRRVPARFSSDLRVDATLNPGSLIYEVAIPINPSSSDTTAEEQRFGLRSSLNAPVGVGLEIPETEEDANLGEESGIPSVTGRRGRSRSPRGRRGRRTPPPEQSSDLPTLSIWTNVLSASGQ